METTLAEDRDVEVTVNTEVNKTTKVAFTNTYEDKTQNVQFKKVNGKNEVDPNFAGKVTFTVRKGSITEAELGQLKDSEGKCLPADEAEKKLKELIKGHDLVNEYRVDESGYAVLNAETGEKITLPMGD